MFLLKIYAVSSQIDYYEPILDERGDDGPRRDEPYSFEEI